MKERYCRIAGVSFGGFLALAATMVQMIRERARAGNSAAAGSAFDTGWLAVTEHRPRMSLDSGVDKEMGFQSPGLSFPKLGVRLHHSVNCLIHPVGLMTRSCLFSILRAIRQTRMRRSASTREIMSCIMGIHSQIARFIFGPPIQGVRH